MQKSFNQVIQDASIRARVLLLTSVSFSNYLGHDSPLPITKCLHLLDESVNIPIPKKQELSHQNICEYQPMPKLNHTAKHRHYLKTQPILVFSCQEFFSRYAFLEDEMKN